MNILGFVDFMTSQAQAQQVASRTGMPYYEALNYVNREKEAEQKRQQEVDARNIPSIPAGYGDVIQMQLQKIAAIRTKLGEFKREDLKQIDIEELKDSDIPTGRVEFIDPKKLKQVQFDVNQTKVDSICKNWAECKKPVIVSSNNYIIDGHHRVAAAIKKNKWVRIIRIKLPAKEALERIAKMK